MCVCVCVPAGCLVAYTGDLIESETNSFSSSGETRGFLPWRGSIVQHFHHNAAVWGAEGSAAGSPPEQRQTPHHICIEVVIWSHRFLP